MSITPLKQGDFYFDGILNAVLCADGAINSFDCHEFTMIWPSYTAVDLPDTAIRRLIPCTFDMWTNEMEYFDAASNQTIRVNLMTGTKAAFSSPRTSQQNMGWSYSEPSKKEVGKPKEPFKKGAVVFHKESRTKWTYDCIDSVTGNYVFRSFYDKSNAMQIFEKNLIEFEELFF